MSEVKSNPTRKEWEAMDWNTKVSSRVNDHHDRIADLEKQLHKLMKNPPRRTVDDLAGNNRKIGYGDSTTND